MPMPRRALSRTFLLAASLLGLAGAVETVSVTWHFLAQPKGAPSLATATPALPQPSPAPTAAALKSEEEQLVAAAKEKSLVTGMATPTPTPAPAAPAPATPQMQVAGLIAQARELREAGDTGTAMSRLRQAQTIYSNYAPIVSEMAVTYEKMGLTDKAIEQWRRIYQMGTRAGIYYEAAEAKLRALQLPDLSPEEASASAAARAQREALAGNPANGSLMPDRSTGSNGGGKEATSVTLSLGKVGTTDDTGTSQPSRRLTLAVPIQARGGGKVDPRDVVIQVFFYETLRDGSVVETNANVTTSWNRRVNKEGEVQAVDWSTPDPETLEVTYAQPEFDSKDPRTKERRNYFGYSVRVYYKGVLNAKFADPPKLLGQFIPPAALPSSNDLPR
ncbi:MAG: tetratricopeptide repeat protein [Chthoniobacteraceae bacterium]